MDFNGGNWHMTNIIDAIKNINPDARFVVKEDKEDFTVDWIEGTTPISNDDLLAKQAQLQAEYDAQEYARNRVSEYPSIQECVHAILDDDLDALQAKRADIKTKYPKG